MEPETIEHLREHDLIEDGKVDRKELAKRAADLFHGRPVKIADDIPKQALIASEVRAALLGMAPDDVVEDEETQLIRQLITPRSTGAIQKALADGHILCSTRIEQRLPTLAGGTHTVRATATFVTNNPDLIEEYHWRPQISRAESAAKEIRGRIDLGVERVPALAARQAAVLLEAAEKVTAPLELEEGE